MGQIRHPMKGSFIVVRRLTLKFWIPEADEVNAESFLVRNSNGDVIGLRDQSLLSMPERARLKKIEAKIRRSV